MNLVSSKLNFGDSPDEYVRLQLGIFRLSLLFSFVAVLLTAVFVDYQASLSVLVGALAGVLYLRLLARSIERLGKSSSSVSKAQLLVPVILFLVATKLPQLQLLPSLVGFLLYKPSLIIHFLLKPYARVGS